MWKEYYDKETCTLLIPKHFNEELIGLAESVPDVKIIMFEEDQNDYANFNCRIDNLPEGITKLVLSGTAFNHPVDHLPQTLTHLTFGPHFNHPVDH
jgi:hypothetical protein